MEFGGEVNIRFNEMGQAAAAAFAVMLIIGLLGVAMLTTATRARQMTFDSTHSRYIARAGVEHAKAHLKENPGWRAGLNGVRFAGGTIESVCVEDVDGGVKITSIGVYGASRQCRTALEETLGIP
jgi:hypothetical protein